MPEEPRIVPEGEYLATIISAELATSLRGLGYVRTKVRLKNEQDDELFMTLASINLRYVLIRLGLPETTASVLDNYPKMVGCRVRVRVKEDRNVDDPSEYFNHCGLLEVV